MSHLNKNRKGWEIYMYIIFDLGLIGVVILVLTVLGITTVGALGAWIAENFEIVLAIILLASVIRTLVFAKESKLGLGKIFLCSLCDCARILPIIYFLWIFFSGFTGLSNRSGLGFLFGVVNNILGFALFCLPELGIITLVEQSCLNMLEDKNMNMLLYVLVSVIGIGLQMLLFWIIMKIF